MFALLVRLLGCGFLHVEVGVAIGGVASCPGNGFFKVGNYDKIEPALENECWGPCESSGRLHRRFIYLISTTTLVVCLHLRKNYFCIVSYRSKFCIYLRVLQLPVVSVCGYEKDS